MKFGAEAHTNNNELSTSRRIKNNGHINQRFIHMLYRELQQYSCDELSKKLGGLVKLY